MLLKSNPRILVNVHVGKMVKFSLLKGLLIFKMSLLWERSYALQIEKSASAMLMWFFRRKEEQNAYQTQFFQVIGNRFHLNICKAPPEAPFQKV